MWRHQGIDAMMDRQRSAMIPPLLIGRLSRLVFGLATFVVMAVVGVDSLGMIGAVLLGALGISFVIGGLAAIPGCEITAIPNLVLPRSMRFHFP